MSKLTQIIHRAFRTQDDVNGNVKNAEGEAYGPSWAKQGWPYYRAAHTEATEALNYLNWFWWKTGSYGKPLTDDARAEVHIELCDILHFGLSIDLIAAQAIPENRIQDYIRAFAEAPSKFGSLDVELEDFIVSQILTKGTFCIWTFARACHAASLSLPQLLAFYFAKSALNKFRWNNGYNLPKGHPDAYVKMWPGAGEQAKEDNHFLIKIVRGLLAKTDDDSLLAGLADGSLEQGVYDRLKTLYPKPNAK